MTDLAATFFTAFLGGLLGGGLGVWLAWRKVRGEVVDRLAKQVVSVGERSSLGEGNAGGIAQNMRTTGL
jgi:hypothetical protein